MLLSVLIPTVGGREAMLHEVKTACEQTAPGCEVLVVYGYSWGEGLNQLATVAKGEYWSCCCDDTVPLPGWFDAGRARLDAGSEPASRYFNPDGSPLHPIDDAPDGLPIGWCRSFLITPQIFAEVGPFIDATWYADWDYSERLVKAGYPIIATDGFAFTHLDGPRGWLTPEEDERQRREYEASHIRQGLPA